MCGRLLDPELALRARQGRTRRDTYTWPMAESTYVEIDREDGVVVARITWPSISEYEATVIGNEIAAAAADGWRLVVDMTSVTFLASSGIGMIVKLHNGAKEGGGKLAVCGLNEQLADLMRMTRMDRLFAIVEDREAGVKKVV